MNSLILIPARGGSKGIPNKNRKLLGGKPLIEYTLAVAKELFPPEQICVSTDDPAIQKITEQAGISVPFLRPAELATDQASTYEVMLHALDWYQQQGQAIETLILLQPTSPFRTTQQVQEALALYTPQLDMVVSVKIAKANPYFVLFEENSDGFLTPAKTGNFTRRQDAPTVFQYNGAIYIINTDSLRQKSLNQFTRIQKYVMDERSSWDLDTPLDWTVAEVLLKDF